MKADDLKTFDGDLVAAMDGATVREWEALRVECDRAGRYDLMGVCTDALVELYSEEDELRAHLTASVAAKAEGRAICQS